MKGGKVYKEAIAAYRDMYLKDKSLKGEKRLSTYKKVLALIRKAAYAGHPEAQFELGQQYDETSFLGVVNPMHNKEKMLYWYSKACDNNNAEACNCLAFMYEVGDGCKKDLSKAFTLYTKSARLGSGIGAENLKTFKRQMSRKGKSNEILMSYDM